jgi:hypothetical protein
MTSRPYAQVLEDGRVAVVTTGRAYVLTPGEIVLLLGGCRSLWLEAVQRGKQLRRAERAEFDRRSRESGREA